ncbi:conserved protein of unknown function [Modestobacter italicus]|uniref:Primosomal protein n=1 Tax=Modestobacter italicus (strain DSM 44449 / CECT 9708 / BC 501) TaxID=2732864 RepID=I4F3H2_MODI5|nr:hypothetical protein [Modestobacter marinus]CCH90185.1 conserved protein of unknown function [Modestobacter marinus]
MARPSIVPIALTLDDRTGYTLWAPPWEEDGEEWQAFLGSTVDLPADINDDDPEAPGPTAVVHLFPSPAALAAFCRVSTDHDLADHPVWPVVATLGPEDLTPDEDHRFDLDGVYDVVAENPDRWAVDELAATLDIVGRLAECCETPVDDDDDDDEDDDDETAFESVAELVSRPEVAALGLGIDAFLGRDGEGAWARLGTAVDELWEDVLEELDDHLDWTGAGTVTTEDYPSAAEEAEARAAEPEDDDEDDDEDLDDAPARPAAGSTAAAPAEAATAGIRTIRGGSELAATPAAVAAAQEFWEAVGILPVEVVVPEGQGVTLRCYVEDRARFLGREGQVFVFPTPVALARFCAGDEAHDLTEIASWAEVADTDTLPLPADQDRYDLVEISEVLAEVAQGAGGLVELRALLQPVEGVLDLAEYAELPRVQQQLAADAPLGRVVARAETDPRAPLSAEEAPALVTAWQQIVDDIGTALVFRSDLAR